MPQHDKRRRPADNPPERSDPSAALGALGRRFVHAIMEDFERHGVGQLKRLRRRRPTAYFRLIGALLPKEYRIKEVELPDLDAISDEEFFAIFNKVRELVAEQDRLEGRAPAALPDPGAP